MTLTEWINIQVKTADSRNAVHEDLAARSGVSINTIVSIDKGMKLSLYAKAEAISEATQGWVTIPELCR